MHEHKSFKSKRQLINILDMLHNIIVGYYFNHMLSTLSHNLFEGCSSVQDHVELNYWI